MVANSYKHNYGQYAPYYVVTHYAFYYVTYLVSTMSPVASTMSRSLLPSVSATAGE